MPIYVATGTLAPGLKVGGTDLSNHVKALEVQQNVADVDTTAMGATTQTHASGLRDDRIIVTFFQDFAASSVDATLAAVNTVTGATIVAYANGTAASSTAPSYTMVGAPFDYSPINLGGPGEASTTQVTFLPLSGSSITRGTT
jgi:hypothetical protein